MPSSVSKIKHLKKNNKLACSDTFEQYYQIFEMKFTEGFKMHNSLLGTECDYYLSFSTYVNQKQV